MTENIEKFMEPVMRARKLIAKDQPWLREYYEKALRHGPNEACCGPVAGFIEEVINLRRENSELRETLKMAAARIAGLERVVEALRWQADQEEAHPFMSLHARAVLAEIEKGGPK